MKNVNNETLEKILFDTFDGMSQNEEGTIELNVGNYTLRLLPDNKVVGFREGCNLFLKNPDEINGNRELAVTHFAKIAFAMEDVTSHCA